MPYFGRTKNKIQNCYNLKDMYEDYVKEVDEDSPYHITYQQYCGICENFYKGVMDKILNQAAEFKMPYNLGRIYVDKKKVRIGNKKKLGIDWDLTNKHGKVIYHLNEHSRGYKYGFMWEKKTYRTKNKNFYRFIPTRTNKRRLAKLIKSGNYDYFSRYE
jgi:hypothetical protein